MEKDIVFLYNDEDFKDYLKNGLLLSEEDIAIIDLNDIDFMKKILDLAEKLKKEEVCFNENLVNVCRFEEMSERKDFYSTGLKINQGYSKKMSINNFNIRYKK